MKMRAIILICAVISIALARKDSPEVVVIKPKSMVNVLRIIHRCEIETKPPQDSFKHMLKGVYNNEAGLHFVYCYLTEAGYVTKDGHFIISKLLSLLKEDHPKRGHMAKIANECNKLVGKDHMDTLSQLFGCFREYTPVVFTL